MSLVVIAGIPDVLRTDFSRLREREIAKGKRKIIWSPLPEPKLYSREYVSRLYEKFSQAVREHVENHSESHNSPLPITAILIYIEYPNSNFRHVREAFFPETLAIPVPPPELPPFPTARNKIQSANNKLIRMLLDALKLGERALPVIKKEVTSRDNKTPILLPLYNFDEDIMSNFLDDVRNRLLNGSPYEAIKSVTRRFETRNPKIVRCGDSRTYFVNPKGLVFKSPGRRNRHGVARKEEHASHSTSCLIRSRFRLGAPFDPRFHYDCEPKRGALPRMWHSCHRQEFSTPRGRSHVNIAPNDHVR